MILKNSFLTDAIENLKRRSWVFWGSFLMFFCCYPGFLLLHLNGLKNSISIDKGEQMNRMMNSVEALYTENLILTFFVILLGVLFGIQGYAYLHDKRQVNFYHSQPIKRSRRFFTLWFNGILLFGVSYVVNMVLGLFVAAGYGCFTGQLMMLAGKATLFYLVLFLSIYHVSVIAVLLTGHTLVSLLAVGVLLFYELAARGICLVYENSFFVTRRYQHGDEAVYSFSSPIMKLVGYFKYQHSRYFWEKELFPYGKTILDLLLLGLIFGTVAWYLYEKRPSEGYGKSISFLNIKEPLRILLLVLFGVSGTILLYFLAGQSLIFGVLGAVFTVFLGHVVIQLIYEVDLKAVRKNLLSAGISFLLTLVFFFSFRFDLFGMDGRIPAKNRVESVALLLPGVETHGNHWVMEDGTELWGNLYSRNQMKLTDLDVVYDALEQAVDPKEFRKNIEISSTTEKYYGIEILFQKKNGKKESRNLYFEETKLGEIFNPIYHMEEFQKITDQTAMEGFLEKYQIRGGEYFNGLENMKLDLSTIKELHKAYHVDVKEAEYAEICSQIPIGKLIFEGTGLMSPTYINRWEVMIYPGFAHTIKILQEKNIPWRAEFSEESLEHVLYLEVSLTDWEQVGSRDKSEVTKTIRYEKKEEIKALLTHALPRENTMWCNGITLYKTHTDDLNLEVKLVKKASPEEAAAMYGEYDEGEGRITEELIFRAEELPERILKDMERTAFGEVKVQ